MASALKVLPTAGNQTAENRRLKRLVNPSIQFPIACVFQLGTKAIKADIINFTFKGAGLKLTLEEYLKLNVRSEAAQLSFYVGKKCIKENLSYKMRWEDLQDTAQFGIEFQDLSGDWIERAIRFQTHNTVSPVLSCADPLDPNRKLYFKVGEVSETGMLLITSLTNKHLFPGMTLRNCYLSIPGSESHTLTAVIENTRLNEEKSDEFCLGVSVHDRSPQYEKALRQYLSGFAHVPNAKERIETLQNSVFANKKIKDILSFSVVSTEAEYNEILKLRLIGYQAHGKVAKNMTWENMGEGLDNEGTLVMATLGSQVVASMELRFGNESKGLRFFPDDSVLKQKNLEKNSVVEVNRLVLHPKIQGTDAVLGMIQRIHSIVISKGGLDVILATSSKFMPLYQRIGGESLNLKIPHPSILNQELHLLVVRKQTYCGENSFNPYAWSTIYEAVHDSMCEAGLVNPLKSGPIRQIKKTTTSLFIKAQQLLRHTTSRSNTDSTSHSRVKKKQKFIDPKYTAQHMLCAVIYPYILEADIVIGDHKVNDILAEIGITRVYLSNQSNWVSVQFLDEFLEKYKRHGNLLELSRRAGIRSMKKDILGINYHLLRHFITPELAFKSFEKVTSKFNRSRSYRILGVSTGWAKVAVGKSPPFPLPQHLESCANWTANFESYIELMTGRPGKVSKKSCCYQGDEECTYEVEWSVSSKRLFSFFKYAIILLIGYGAFATTANRPLQNQLEIAILAGLSCVIGAVSFLSWIQTKKQRSQLNVEFERCQSEALEKYSELQTAKNQLDHRYKEALLLEEISKELQSANDLTRLLSVSLGSACKLLDFSRAFLMLFDEKENVLKTSALVGISDAKHVWDFRVEIKNNRQNPLLLSSVYLTGNPVMIDNIEAHKFQLGLNSQALIAKLQTKGFIMVAIPAASNKNWGVIIADKADRVENLERKDVVLLQRVAQALGLALDKQARFEHETHLRAVFQRFVPVGIVDDLSGIKEPILGGNIRDIVCMFLDIRSFTAITQNMPPHSVIDMLNRVFGSVQAAISPSGGIIDKFLGDGLLATWGAVGSAPPTPDNIMQDIFQIFENLKSENERLALDGLPLVQIGVGLHRGPAVVGNVGSSERMEFTSIGATVNIASRLEGLCKTLECELVISENFLKGLSSPIKYPAEIISDVTVKGIDQKLSVGIFRKFKQKAA